MLDTVNVCVEIALRKMMTSGRKCAILFTRGSLWTERSKAIYEVIFQIFMDEILRRHDVVFLVEFGF